MIRTGSEPKNDLLTLDEVLEELGVPRSTFYKWRRMGKAPKTIRYPNGSLHVRRRDLDAWLDAQEQEAP